MKPTYEELERQLEESRREFRAADATIHNLELKLTDMAVQLANAESKCRELAAECAGMKAAFDKPQAYLSWHAIPPTWEDPLPCGEYLDVHDDAGHKNSDGTDCWPVYAKPEIKTPATDAFLAEVRAQGVDEFLRGSQLPYQIATVLADYDNVDDATLQTVIWSGQPPEPDGDVWHLEYVSRGNAIVRAVLKELRKGDAL
ncbi:hypothetical protein OGV58_13565 [Citrobacter sp. Cf097]|uniref:hypothetical protein n=1 Tax=Citrobacter sp. Cf097 TaxID=2985059 RepID=UPI002578B699|nr:hypothetical protein [Citrobacter sp. Cf097]MDM3203032.1 hypothetical protein [Citrobacter sp. Cf097]